MSTLRCPALREPGSLHAGCIRKGGQQPAADPAFQKPPDTVITLSTLRPPQSLGKHGAVERTWTGNQDIDPIPTTSVHFLVGSLPNSSEGDSVHLSKKAAGLDTLEGPRQP